MSIDPRAALDRFIEALESHLTAVAARRGDDPVVEAAYDTLADAFELYDEALYETYEAATPFVLFGEDDSEDEGGDDEIDDDADDDEEADDDDL